MERPAERKFVTLILLGVLLASVAAKSKEPVCLKTPGGLTCAIKRLADCELIPVEFQGTPERVSPTCHVTHCSTRSNTRDNSPAKPQTHAPITTQGPYIVSTCQNAYHAVTSIVHDIAARAGRTPSQVVGSMNFYANDPRPNDQTLGACMFQSAPWNASETVSPGIATCDLAGFVMSPSNEVAAIDDPENPIGLTKQFPGFFAELMKTRKLSSPSRLDLYTRSTGAHGVMQFLAEYTRWQDAPLDELPFYQPNSGLANNPGYHGLSGGGGDGMGGELLTAQGATVLSWGGGGGAGFTSNRTTTYIGGGGGGGMQHTKDAINGLGIGAGTSYREGMAQYTISSPANATANATVAEYAEAMTSLFETLSGQSFVLQGGGGSGAGYQYLRPDGVEEYPQSMSSGCGFSFSYEVAGGSAARVKAPTYPTSRTTTNLYTSLGAMYKACSLESLAFCGSYDSWKCVCQAQNKCIVRKADEIVAGDASQIPSWLTDDTCP